MHPQLQKSASLEVYIHDPKESFSSVFGAFGGEKVIIYPNRPSDILIRPQLLSQLNRKRDPCKEEENYSYVKVS